MYVIIGINRQGTGISLFPVYIYRYMENIPEFFQRAAKTEAKPLKKFYQIERLLLIYLSVDSGHQHHGLAELLMDEVINYAQKHKMLISLETHNPNNVPIYEHFGFITNGIVEKPHFDLKQYCMIREATV